MKKRLMSFYYAFKGLPAVWGSEPNFRIHVVCAVLAIGLSLILGVSHIEFLIVLTMIGLVLCMEVVNAVVEKVCDFISPQQDPRIGAIKDMSAASVLIAASVALIVGILIFLPRLVAFS